MSRSCALSVVCLAALAGGCGSGETSIEDAPISYVPPDAALAVILATDLESDGWKALEDRLLAGPLAPESSGDLLGDLPAPTTLEGYLRQAASLSGLDFDEDVAPLLGGKIVVGITELDEFLTPEDFVAAIDTGDEQRLRAILERLELRDRAEVGGASIYADASGSTQLAVDGSVLVFATGDGEPTLDGDSEVPNAPLRAAIEQERAGTGLEAATFEEHAESSADPLIQIHGDLGALFETPEPFTPSLKRASAVPWVDALESFDATISFTQDQIQAAASISTDGSAITAADLPLASDTPTPELVRIPGEIAGASADQSQSTVFLLDLARAAFPDSRFVRDVATVERELGIDFEREFLRQFNGPSASSLPIGDEFAARSTIADPVAMAETLRKLAPDIGRLIQDLQGLQGRGLIPLFLFAPDAPIAPGVLEGSRIDVSRVKGEPDLYEATNLIPPGFETATPLPQAIVFGLIDGVFVVASDVERANEIAQAAPTPAPEGLEGASITTGDLGPLRDELENALGFDPGPLGTLEASAEATTEGLSAKATISVP